MKHDFTKYKEMLMTMEEQKRSVSSTSADSKRQKSEENNQRVHTLDGDDQRPGNELGIDRSTFGLNGFVRSWGAKKQGPPKKQKSNKKKSQKLSTQIHLQPDGTGGSIVPTTSENAKRRATDANVAFQKDGSASAACDRANQLNSLGNSTGPLSYADICQAPGGS